MTIVGEAGLNTVIQPSGTVARLVVTRRPAGSIDSGDRAVPFTRLGYGDVEGLPPPVPGTWYLVSLPVALAARRADLLVLDDVIRDEDGLVIACRALGAIDG